MLRGFGPKVGPTTPRTFEARVRELVEGHPTLVTVAGALPAARTELLRRLEKLEKRLVEVGRADERVRRLTTVPGVGNLVALTFVAAIGDHGVRTMLDEAANVMLTRPVKGSAPKDWALAVAKRPGPRKAPRRSSDRRCFAVGSRGRLEVPTP